MNQSNINDTAGSSGDMAVVGEGTPNRTPVSIQVLQNIYHELTGKSEEVSKTYDESFHVVFNDFKQLNLRIGQICEQYNICSSNCSVSVFYINDTKDTFSSFERFEAFNTGSTSSVESVLVTYNFLLILPKLAQPQSYTISVRIASPVAIQRKMSNIDMPKIFRLMGGARTAVVSIKYVDYAVARTLLNTIDEWFNALPQARSNAAWRFIRSHTDWTPLITRYLAGAGVLALMIFLAPYYLNSEASLLQLAHFLLISGACIFAAYKIADHLGTAAEDSIDDWLDLAYICITDGDKKEVALAKSRNQGAIVWGILKLAGGLCVSIAAKLIAFRITNIP
ncbi:hypothetical protein [Variovorax sp. HJSM1_2]|uniref:hypothetical protein n=1 Tax=Variovorax sp. HJSM1_2 TaxID=3366263 RepID=UPI003BD6A464